MESVDLSLLPHLQALLETASVTRAAALRALSAPAMSRALSKLREQTGDALLVRAGNRMVLTPRALALRESLPGALEGVMALLVKPGVGRPKASRPFRIRASDAVPSLLGQLLLGELERTVEGASLVFVEEGDESDEPLRSGELDLDLGVQSQELGPELIVRPLFTEQLVGVAGRGHPVLVESSRLEVFCRTPQVVVSRRGVARGPVDEALRELGRRRDVPIVVASYLDAALLACDGELITLLPRVMAMRLTASLPLEVFTPPVSLPSLRVAMAWHPRMKDDPLHRELREALTRLVAGQGEAGEVT
ncbi:MAG: LysR family transcriptional regulator [Myxococcaceae bacterium]|nr:LysR family transcriptional regulator [Myxococcaceae bacterium]